MKKYVLACVEVPIQINEDESTETLQDYANIKIIKSIESPNEVQKIETPVQEQIKEILQQEGGIVVTKAEMETFVPKKQKNTSFKRNTKGPFTNYVSTLGWLVGQPNANLVSRPYLVKVLTRLVDWS